MGFHLPPSTVILEGQVRLACNADNSKGSKDQCKKVQCFQYSLNADTIGPRRLVLFYCVEDGHLPRAITTNGSRDTSKSKSYAYARARSALAQQLVLPSTTASCCECN